MKHLYRIMVAAWLATTCLTPTTAKPLGVDNVDLTEIGLDSTVLAQLSDSTVLELARMAIRHKEHMRDEEMQHEEQLMMMRYNHQNPLENATNMILIGCIFAAIPVLCVFIYKIMTNRSRKRREEAKHEMLLDMVSNGQTLTPELVESITKDKEQKKTSEELNMYVSLRKLFLGSGLVVFAIVLCCMLSGIEPFSPVIALIGIFYAAQGLAGYLTLRLEKQQPENL